VIQIELICHELKRLLDDYYRCDNPEIKKSIDYDIKLLSKALCLSDLPECISSEY
jgi:hypothetical protein